MNYKLIVKTQLEKIPVTRDDDQYLYALVLAKLNFLVTERSAFDLITEVQKKNLPSLDTITRLRRMLQMEHVDLRGNDWDIRHGVKVEKALNDIGYTTN